MPRRFQRATLAIILTVFFCSAYSSGEDHFATGDSFLNYCSVVEQNTENLEVVDLTRSIECVAYPHGFIAGVFVQNTEDRKPPYCPTNSTGQQDVRVVLAYLREHPKETQKPLPTLAIPGSQTCLPLQTTMKHVNRMDFEVAGALGAVEDSMWSEARRAMISPHRLLRALPESDGVVTASTGVTSPSHSLPIGGF